VSRQLSCTEFNTSSSGQQCSGQRLNVRRWLSLAIIWALIGSLSILIFTAKEAQSQTLDTETAPQPVQDTAEPVQDTAEPVLAPVQDTAEPVLAPVAETAEPVLAPVVDTAEPVLGTLPEPTPVVGTGPETNAPAIGTLQPDSPLALSSTSPSSLVPRPLESASSLVVSGSTLVVPQRNLVELSSSYGSAGVLNSYSAHVSHSLLSGLISTLSYGGVEDLLNQRPQPFSPGVPPVSGSSSGSSSGYGGGNGLLGILALVSLLLLSGKFLWSRREFLKPSSALLPIIERPG
jgi:hypothetical protein